MRKSEDMSPLEMVGHITANPIGAWHYVVATVITVALVELTASIYTRWPMVTLTLLAGAAAMLATIAVALQRISHRLIMLIVPLQKETRRLAAELKGCERKLAKAEVDRDRWKSAVERAAGDSIGGTPTDIIARQALRIRALERTHGHENSTAANGNGDLS